jgi:hypothetical protein
VAATVLAINHVNSLRLESASRAPGEVAHFIGVRCVIFYLFKINLIKLKKSKKIKIFLS